MKKALKRSLSLLLAITIIFGSAYVGFSEVDFDNVFAVKAKAAKSGICGANLAWTLDDIGTLTISGTGEMYQFSSTSNVPWIYYRSSIINVVIGNSVTSISDYALFDCTSLDSVTIGNSVISIGRSAFSGCTKLTSIVIPNSVTSISDYAFYGCTRLASITIGDGVKSIGTWAFYECTRLYDVYITDIAAWCGIDFVGYESNPLIYAYNVYLNDELVTELVIPDSVTSIGDYAFKDFPRLTSVKIGNSVTSIGNYVFEDCTSLTFITIPDSVISIGGSAFNRCTKLTSIVIPNSVINIGGSAFSGCSSLASVTIGNSVTSIGGYAFSSCKSLTSVTISNSVTSIGNYVFEDCTNLTSITIPDSVTSIGSGAFSNTYYYNNLSNWKNDVLYIGNHLIEARDTISGVYVIKEGTKTIAVSAFDGCASLTSITIPDSVTSIGHDAFKNCKSLISVTIGNSVTSIGNYAFYGCTSLTSITIPDSVTSIGDGAFYGCIKLTSIVIPDSVTSLGSYAFKNCTSLISVTIGNSVTSIGDYAFDGCTSLTSIVIPDSVTSIGVWAFNDCTSLTSATIGNGVTSIGDGAFYGCTNLASVTIGNSVTSIGEFAFSGCASLRDVYIIDIAAWCGIDFGWYSSTPLEYASNLYLNGELVTNIVIPDGVTTLPRYAFSCTSLTSISIPDSVTSIDGSAFGGCTSLTSIVIPDSVTSIGVSAFGGCTSLTSITIPDSVTSIGYSAFSNCTRLISVTIGNSVTSIGDYAFNGCTSLTSIVIPDSVTSIGYDAFKNCKSLISVTIGNSVTSIGNYAFYGCTSLTSITIPDSVTSIGEKVFDGVYTKLLGYKDSYVEIYAKTNNIPFVPINGDESELIVCGTYGKVNWQINKLTGKLTISCDGIMPVFNSSETLPWKAYERFVDSVVIENATSISDYTFSGMEYIRNIYIPDSVTSIGEAAFSNCIRLTSFTIPDSVTSIDRYAFYGCTSLTSFTISHSVTYVGSYVLTGCTSLNRVTVYNDDFDISCFDLDSTVEICANEGSKAHRFALETGKVFIPHIHSLIKCETILPTCKEQGYTVYICNDCKNEIKDDFIGTTGHTLSAWIVDKEATVTAPGTKYKKCTVCGTKLETAVIPQLNPATPKVKAVNTIKGINVSWNAVNGAAKYVVYKRLGTSSVWDVVTTTTGLSYADNNTPLAGSYYVYSVRAYNSADILSDYVKENTATVQRIVTPKVSATNALNGINITWEKVNGATKYNVYRRVGGSSSWVLLGSPTGTSLVDKNVMNGTYYVYSVRAVNGANISAFDTNKTVTIQPVTAPTAIATNLANGVQITWSKATGATKYNVYRRNAGSSSWVLVGTTTSTSLVDKGLTNGKYFVYSIRAINGTGYSAFDTKKTDTIQPITAPTAKVAKKSNGVQVSWNSVSGATKYNVYRRLGGTSTWIYVGTTTSTTLLDKGVVKGKSYAYSIRAINGTGYSAYNIAKCAAIKYS